MAICTSCGFGINFERSFCVKCGAELLQPSTRIPATFMPPPNRPRQIWSACAAGFAIVSVLTHPLSFGVVGVLASCVAIRRHEQLAVVALGASALGLITGSLIDVIV